MLLLCDIGNSFIKTASVINNSLSDYHSFKKSEDFIYFLEENKFSEIAFSSVVPSKTDKLINYCNSKGIKYFFINKNSDFNISIEYKTPDSLGTDRICSCEGAYFLYKKSKDFASYNQSTFILTADFGTATTINFIKYPGIFFGGIISPGVEIMFQSLNKNTSALPLVNISDYKSLIGDDTKSSIASGSVTAVKGLLNESISFLRKEFNASEIKIFITGGNAEKIVPFLNLNFSYEKALVLMGVKSIYDKNKN